MTAFLRRIGSRWQTTLGFVHVASALLLFSVRAYASVPVSLEGRTPPLSADSLYTETRPAMGTDFSIFLYTDDKQTATSLFESAFDEIERIEQLLSTYRSSSELSRINREAAGKTVYTDGELADLLGKAFEWSVRTQRAFDPTVGALMDIWGFREPRPNPPSQDEIKAALAQVGSDLVVFSRPDRRISFRVDGLWMDSGAFGKGYALDRVATVLKENRINSALIVAGQSTYLALDAPPGERGWRVSIADLEHRDTMLSTVYLHNMAFSTSGGSQRYLMYNGKKVVHIVDPRSGLPAEGTLQASILTDSAFDADILSTAAFVLGPGEGAELVRSVQSASGFIVPDSPVNRSPTLIRWHED